MAIVLLTVTIRLAMFPIAQRQFASMAKMRVVQPKLKAVQERYKDDKERQQREVMALYKTEGVNPLAGCLPTLLQIPIFYALYKVLMLTIEMRHQPFVAWIRDLSAPDPLTPVNLFGVLPFTPPGYLHLGVLAILLGGTMWAQFRLSPAGPDPTTQQVMGDHAVGDDVHLRAARRRSAALLRRVESDLDRAAAAPLRPTPAAEGSGDVSDAVVDPDLLEPARKLFAGPVTFLKSAPALEFLPDPTAPEVAFAGRSNVGKSSLLNALVNRNALARHLQHAGADAGAELLRCRGTAGHAAGRHARLRLRQGTARRGPALAVSRQRLSARPSGAQAARWC